MSGPREFTFLTNGDKARTKNLSYSCGENKPAGINPDDFVDFMITGSGSEEFQ